MDVLKKCIRKGTLANTFVPVLTGTAFKNKGVQPLLDAVVDFMPSPIEVEDIKGVSVSLFLLSFPLLSFLRSVLLSFVCYMCGSQYFPPPRKADDTRASNMMPFHVPFLKM